MLTDANTVFRCLSYLISGETFYWANKNNYTDISGIFAVVRPD